MTHFNTIKYSKIVFPTKEKQTTALDKSYGNWSGIFLFFLYCIRPWEHRDIHSGHI